MSAAPVAPVMSRTDPVTPAPKTISDVRDAHVALMRDWRTIEDAGEAADRAETLREQVCRAGRDIAEPGERDEAQGILDYWISAVAALPGQRYPAFVALAEYVGAAAALAGSSAREVYDKLGSEKEKLAVRKLFEDLLTKGPEGITRSGARPRAVLKRRLKLDSTDALLAKLVGAGALTTRAGATLDEDTFEVTDANLANSWPQLNAWLDDTADYESKRDILLQRAERWDKLGRSRAYLARGEELKGIERFEDESETLDEFIAASKSGKRQFVVWAGIAGSILVIVLLFLAWRSWELSDANSKASQAEAQAARADAAAARAELSAKRITQDYNMVVEQRAVAEPQLRSADAGQMQISDMKRLDVPSLKGAIWLGSDKVPQVSAAKWKGEFTSPSKAIDGTPYRVLADVNLRDAMPPLQGDYKSPPKKAVVRAGTLLIVTGQTQAYDRPTGRQYWAPVQIVPRIYIQHTGTDKPAIKQLQTKLSEAGFDVPAAEVIETAKGKRELRYFDKNDGPVAELLLQRLAAEGPTPDTAGQLACRSFAGSRASNRFALEIWIDPKAPRPPATATCP